MVGSFLLLLFYRVTKRPIIKHVTARIVSSTRCPRNTSQSNRRANRALPTDERIELDSHADTVVLGSNAVALHYTGNECEVSHTPMSMRPSAMCRLFVVQPYGQTKMTTRATSSCLIRPCGWGTPSLIPSLTQISCAHTACSYRTTRSPMIH